ncbi:hypothetical protein LK09_02280 [Microbacterium mangrovi]|uniref:Uncharacterized protein n=2 Tax=Microbacterium mangrovi TaxID=1348253 RepID=A0A0B2ACI0_9MICO|nr:hypothetical protein LK09_02280 [Microbacterium mangrovi]
MSLIAAILALVAGLVLSVLPLYSTASSTTSSSGGTVRTTQTLTVLQVMGGGYLVILLLPAVVAAVPLVLRGRAASIAAVVAAVLVVSFTVLGIMSIGLFYLPAAVFTVIAAALRSAPRHPSPSNGDGLSRR